MARRSARPKETDDDSGMIGEKDFAKAVQIYRQDILPAQSKVGEFAQEQSTAFKAIKKQCGIQPQAARTVFRLSDMEDAKRDDWIRCFIGLCNELKIPLQSNDLVDQAEAASRPKPVLATLAPSDGSETDLTDAADTEARDLDLTGANPFEEATSDELAKQAGRGKSTKGKDKPAHGTGAAAIAAMNAGKPDLKAVN
jgi:hypothetical protein